MPIYHKLGKIPAKRHIQFEKSDGSLYYEQLFGTIGFDGMASLMYHIHRPTQVMQILESQDLTPKSANAHNMMMRKFIGFDVEPKDDFLESRVPMMFNKDCIIGVAAPKQSLREYFIKMPILMNYYLFTKAQERFVHNSEILVLNMAIIW